jgi:hypothetical protein
MAERETYTLRCLQSGMPTLCQERKRRATQAYARAEEWAAHPRAKPELQCSGREVKIAIHPKSIARSLQIHLTMW